MGTGETVLWIASLAIFAFFVLYGTVDVLADPHLARGGDVDQDRARRAVLAAVQGAAPRREPDRPGVQHGAVDRRERTVAARVGLRAVRGRDRGRRVGRRHDGGAETGVRPDRATGRRPPSDRDRTGGADVRQPRRPAPTRGAKAKRGPSRRDQRRLNV